MIVAGPAATVNSTRASAFSRRDLLPLGGFLSILVALFWRVLVTSDMFFYRDVFSYTFPRAEFMRRILLSGHLPLWNPYFSFGEPALANPNFLFFYPSTLLLVLLPAGYAYCLHYVLHFALAGIGTYGLARRWDQSRLAAFFAASAFTFSGPVLSLGNFYNQVAAVAWIPWALLATDYAVESRSRRPWILLAAVLALQFLAAEPLTLFITFGLALAYALARGGNLRRLWDESNRRIVGAFIIMGILMLLLVAVELFPSLHVLGRSRRGAVGLPFNEVAYWSLHPLSLVEMVVPNFFGSVFDASTLWTFVLASRNQPYYPSLFLGFVVLLAALVGASIGRNPRRRFVFWAALLLLFLAFGRFTPVFSEAYLLVPLLRVVRFPAKFVVPMAFLAALLAGWGVDALREADVRPARPRTLAPLGLVLALATAAWSFAYLDPSWIIRPATWMLTRTNSLFIRDVRDQISGPAAVASAQNLVRLIRLLAPELIALSLGAIVWLLALERGRAWARWAVPVVLALGVARLVLVNDGANPTVPKIFYTYRPPVVEQPADPSDPYRFSHLIRNRGAHEASDSRLQQFLSFPNVPDADRFSAFEQASFRDRLLLARGGMQAGVEMAQNLDMEGALPARVYEFWIYELDEAPDPSRADCLLGRANVKYIVRDARQPSATTRQVATVFNGSPAPSYLYETRCYQPRAFVASQALESTSASETLAKLSDPGFEAGTTVILSGEARSGAPPTTLGLSGAGSSAEAARGQVRIIARQPNSVTLRATLPRSGYVVLLDRWDPGWRATIDGHAAPILRADWMFRAVQAPAGTHTLHFSYHARGLAPGCVISLVTLILLAAVYRKG